MRISDWSSDVCSSDLLQRLYLDIEQTRFPDRLQVEVAMPDELKNACVPVLILQPIIENAIKYGVSPSKGKIAIRLTASAEYGLLVLRIENDIDAKEPVPASSEERRVGKEGVSTCRSRW